MTVNATVWNQFFAGLVPLCLSAADYQLVGPNYAALERCDVSVLGLLWGFRMWGVSAVRQYPLLKIALGRWARGQGLSADSIFSDASSQGALEIALAASVLIEVPTVSEGLPMEVLLLGFDSTPSVGAMVCMLVDDACRLYSSPYMKTSAQARAVWFVHGVFLSLQYSADCCHQGEGLEVRKFAELILTHFAEKNIFVDLALYFSIIIKTVLGGRLNAHDASHPHSGAIFSYLETLSKCTAVFADMLCASHLRFQAHREKNSAVSSGIGKVVELAAHSVQDVLLMLERPTSLVTLPLLQCCSALVLPLSVMIVNSAVPTTVDSDSLSDLLLRLCRIIHSLDVPSAAAFRAEAASTDAVVKSLNADVLLECSGLYGKFSSKFITAKWSLLRSGISAVLCATKSSSFSDFLQSVLQTVSESITCFPLLAVPEAISCCSDILHFVLTAPEGSAALQNSQKVDLVARMLESCWKSCVSDDSLFTASIFSFIKLAFQPATLRLHESLPVLVSMIIYHKVTLHPLMLCIRAGVLSDSCRNGHQ